MFMGLLRKLIKLPFNVNVTLHSHLAYELLIINKHYYIINYFQMFPCGIKVIKAIHGSSGDCIGNHSGRIQHGV